MEPLTFSTLSRIKPVYEGVVPRKRYGQCPSLCEKSNALNASLTCTATPIAANFPGDVRSHLIHTRFDLHLSSNFYLLLRYDHIAQNGSMFCSLAGPDVDL